MGLESLFKRFVDNVDVVYDLLSIPISGVFAFDELELSSSLVGRVYNERCMSVVFGVGSLGSLRCSIPAERRRVDRRVSMTIRSCIFGCFFCLGEVCREWRLWVVCGM